MQGTSKNVLLSGSSPFMALLSISAIVMLIMFHFGSSLNQEGYMSALKPLSLRSSSTPLDPSIQKLVDALKESVETVTKNTGLIMKSSTDTLNIVDQEHWKRQHSCKSRTELVSWYNHRLHSPNSRSSSTLVGSHAKWKPVLEEYANLHSLCIRAAGNLTEYFFARNTSSGCKFVIAEAKTGMGNKVLLMTSAVVYAILTQRVILIPTSTSIPGIMCEPFLGSTWALSDDLQARSVSLWTEAKDFLDTLDTAKAGGYTGPPAYAARVDDNWQPVSRYSLTQSPSCSLQFLKFLII
jgi:xyloglucan fucosyltransferase